MLGTEKGETMRVGGKESSEDAFSPLPPPQRLNSDVSLTVEECL